MQAPARGLPLTVLLGAIAGSIGLAASCGEPDEPKPALCNETSGTAIFDQRIAPLLSDDQPKSCNAKSPTRANEVRPRKRHR